MLAGFSTLAIVCAINDTNGGLYMALMGRYGTPQEMGAYSVMSLESGPFITMMTLGGLLAFPWQTLLGAILPLLAGIVLGNLDREMRDFLGKAAPALIPFFAFAIGSSLVAVTAFGLTTALNYAGSGLVDWPLAAVFVVGGIGGGVVGAFAAGQFARRRGLLGSLFAGLIFVVATYMAWRSATGS